MRPARVLAIARRDLAMETSGRRGLAIPLLFLGMLLPIAAIPAAEQRLASTDPPIYVTGEVPLEVSAVPGAVVGPHPFAVRLDRGADGRLHARGDNLPKPLRDALDGDDAQAVAVVFTFPDIYIPRRTALLALLTASILVGAVAESLPGERSRKTFETLLTAGVTRLELVAGKVLAWGGLGALGTVLSALITVALGRVPLGLWLLPLPLVPLTTVAVGFWSVRRAADVVGASTVTVRIVPAILGGFGIVAWGVGIGSPVLGAAVPLGGALLASGDTWPGIAPPLVATASTGALLALLVAGTARELESDPIGREVIPGAAKAAALFTAAALLAHHVPVTGPILWALAGNAGLAAGLSSAPGVVASSLLLGLVVAVAGARESEVGAALGLRMPRPADVGWTALAAAGTVAAWFATAPVSGVTLGDLARRGEAAVFPASVGLVFAAVVAQELLFRGAVQRLVGPVLATVASIVVLTPGDPLRGLVLGGSLAAITAASGSSANAIAGRLLATGALLAIR